MRERLISMRAYAKLSGLTVGTVSRQGCDSILPTHGSKKLIDPAEADEARRTKLDHTLNKGQVVPINDARARRLAAQAELAELAREKRRLVPVDEVQRVWFNTLRNVRDRVLALSDRLSHVLASETNPARINEIMKTELTKALTGLSEEIKGQMG